MWAGVTDFNGHPRVTRFGSFPYATARTYNQKWGVLLQVNFNRKM